MVTLEKFNSPSFLWGPYFSDTGRALAAGEQDFLQEAIQEQIEPEVDVLWSNKYAPSSCFTVFSSKGGTWRLVPDQQTGNAIMIAIGQSTSYPDRVEIGVETVVKYDITRAGCL